MPDMVAVSAAPSKAKRCPAATPGPVYPRICLHPRVAWLYDRTVMPCCPCGGPSDRPVSVHPHGLRHLTQPDQPTSSSAAQATGAGHDSQRAWLIRVHPHSLQRTHAFPGEIIKPCPHPFLSHSSPAMVIDSRLSLPRDYFSSREQPANTSPPINNGLARTPAIFTCYSKSPRLCDGYTAAAQPPRRPPTGMWP